MMVLFDVAVMAITVFARPLTLLEMACCAVCKLPSGSGTKCT